MSHQAVLRNLLHIPMVHKKYHDFINNFFYIDWRLGSCKIFNLLCSLLPSAYEKAGIYLSVWSSSNILPWWIDWLNDVHKKKCPVAFLCQCSLASNRDESSIKPIFMVVLNYCSDLNEWTLNSWLPQSYTLNMEHPWFSDSYNDTN